MLNLGDIRFGLTADPSALTRAQAVLRSFADSVNSVVTKTDDMSAALQSAAARQEKAIRSSLSAMQEFAAAAQEAGAPSDMIRQNELDFKRLAGVMQSGQLNALDFARAVDRYNMSLSQSQGQLSEFTESQKAAASAEAELTEQTTRAAAGVDRIRIAIGGAEAAAVRMTAASAALNEAQELGIIDQAEATALYSSYSKKVVEATESQKGFLGTLLAIREELSGLRSIAFTMNSLVASFFFLTSGLNATVGAAANFDAQMARIEGLTNASKEQVQQWGQQILQIAPQLAQSPKALADALYFVASSGVPISQAMNIVQESAKGATAGLGDLKDIASLVTSVMNVYGPTNISAAKAVDILAGAVKAGKGEPAEFATALGQVLSVAGQMKVPFDQVAGAIAEFTNQGLSAQNAATLLQNLLRSFLDPSTAAKKAMSDLYYQGQQLSSGWIQQQIASKGLIPTLQEISVAAEGNDQALAQVTGSSRSFRAILGLLNNDASQTKNVMDQVTNSAGTMQNAFDIMMTQAATHFTDALSALQTELIEVSNSVLPAFSAAADFFTNHVHGIFEAIGALAATIIGYFVGTALVGLVNAVIAASVAVGGFTASVLEATSAAEVFEAVGLELELSFEGIATVLSAAIPVIGAVIGLVVALGYAFRSATDNTATDLHTRITNLTGAVSGGAQAPLQSALQDNQKLIDNLQSQIEDTQDRINAYQPTSIPGAAGQGIAAGAASAHQADITQLQHLQDEFHQATADANALQDAMKKVNSTLQAPAVAAAGGSTGGVGLTPITDINAAIAAYKKYQETIVEKTTAVNGATTAVQNQFQAEAQAKAVEEANAIATKVSNGNEAEKADILAKLKPLIDGVTTSYQAYLQAQADKKGEDVLTKEAENLAKIKTATDQVQAGQDAYNETLQKLKDIGAQITPQVIDDLQKIQAEAEQAFAFNKYQDIVKSALSSMQSDFSTLLQNLGSSNALQTFAQSLRDTFEKTIADAISAQIMTSIGGELNDLFTGLGTLLGFTAPTDMLTSITTATTTGATTMATAIVTAGTEAASIMAEAIASAGAASSAANIVGSSVASGTSGSITASHGAAFANGIRKFASGGIVNTATNFNYAGGTGQMGEAGTEGILPLSRGTDGNLGVTASGIGGTHVELSVNFQIDARGTSAQQVLQIQKMINDSAKQTQAQLIQALRRKGVPRA